MRSSATDEPHGVASAARWEPAQGSSTAGATAGTVRAMYFGVRPRFLCSYRQVATATTLHDLHGIPLGRVCDS